jgi:hypothetical protein
MGDGPQYRPVVPSQLLCLPQNASLSAWKKSKKLYKPQYDSSAFLRDKHPSLVTVLRGWHIVSCHEWTNVDSHNPNYWLYFPLPEYLQISSVTATYPKMRPATPIPYSRLFELSNTRSKTRLQMREHPTSGPESLGSSGGLRQFDDLFT